MKTYAFLMRTAMLALSLACISLMSSCYNDDAEECPPDNSPVTVRLNVSAAQIGDLNGTRAAGDVVPAGEHEFINTLKVYIVNADGQIVEELPTEDLSTNILAQTGDLEEWHSGPLTLAPGTYTVYAFANIEKYVGETDSDNELTGEDMLAQCFPDNGTVDKETLNEYRLNDPAARINFKDMYIPMSGVSEELTITGSGDLNNSGNGDFTVYLDRLVSKVNMTVSGLPGEVNENTTVTFSNYSEKVPLMAASTTSTHGERRAATQAMHLQSATQTDDGYQLSFYVNETPDGDEGFTVTLNTGNTSSGGISEYMAVTNCTEIPRNRIYPLSLTFPEFVPQFTWKSWEAGIDSVPVEVEVKEENYIVKIASGNTFEFSVTGVQGGTLTEATWGFGEDVSTKIANIQINGATIGGAISAGVSVGEQIPLTVTVDWTGSYTDPSTDTSTDRNFTRTYNVTIETINIWGTDYKQNTRSGSWRAYRLAPEVLNMFNR